MEHAWTAMYEHSGEILPYAMNVEGMVTTTWYSIGAGRLATMDTDSLGHSQNHQFSKVWADGRAAFLYKVDEGGGWLTGWLVGSAGPFISSYPFPFIFVLASI